MVFQCINMDLANVNAWKTMFDPYINHTESISEDEYEYASKTRQIYSFW